jgi:hypothetical protein
MKIVRLTLIGLLVTATFVLWTDTQADVMKKEISGGVTKVFVIEEDWQPDGFKEGIVIPVAYAADADIFLDGIDSEPAWNVAKEVTVPLSYGETKSAQLKAIYTNEDVVIRVRWADDTEDRLHHPWIWDEELGNYKPGPQIEDSLVLSFEAGCEWFPSFLVGYDFDFDAWQWLAARTDPLGQALDLAGSMKPIQLPMNSQYPIRNDENEWNLRFTDLSEDRLHKTWDELDRQYMIWPIKEAIYHHAFLDETSDLEFARQLKPPASLPSSPAKVLPQYEPIQLEGNPADVRAKGSWEDGYWTVEFRRKRITPGGTTWDVQFNRLTQFSLHVFNHVERLDESSESPRLFLQFLEREPAVDVQLAGE